MCQSSSANFMELHGPGYSPGYSALFLRENVAPGPSYARDLLAWLREESQTPQVQCYTSLLE